MQTSHDTQHTCKARNNLYCMGKSVEFFIIMDCHGTVTGTSVSLLNYASRRSRTRDTVKLTVCVSSVCLSVCVFQL